MSGSSSAVAALEQCSANDLLLLVGSNPMPNYVAGRLLRAPGGTVHLLHTREVATVANSLCCSLGAPCQLHEIDSVDAGRIRQSAKDIVREIQ